MNDNEINALFAVKVCGWRRELIAVVSGNPYAWVRPGKPAIADENLPDFVNSPADVLPWLEKAFWYIHSEPDPKTGKYQWVVFHANLVAIGIAPTFARAACLALLKAHGVEIPS